MFAHIRSDEMVTLNRKAPNNFAGGSKTIRLRFYFYSIFIRILSEPI